MSRRRRVCRFSVEGTGKRLLESQLSCIEYQKGYDRTSWSRPDAGAGCSQ